MANDQNTWIGYLNYVEEAATTLSTTAAAQGDRVVGNLKTTSSDEVWRIGGLSGGSTSADLTITFDAEKTIDKVSIQFERGEYPGVTESSPNYASTDTIRVRLYDDADVEIYDSTAENSGVVAGYMIYVKELGASYDAKKIVIDFEATSRATATFFDVKTVGAWPTIEPGVGFTFQASHGWKPNREQQTTTAGLTYTARFEPMRRWRAVFDFLSVNEADQLDEMIRYSAESRQVLVHRGDLPAGKRAMLALVSSTRDQEYRSPDRLKQSLSFSEFI